eukprot:scaffold3388_cov62-Attheya_sp.AAC.5
MMRTNKLDLIETNGSPSRAIRFRTLECKQSGRDALLRVTTNDLQIIKPNICSVRDSGFRMSADQQSGWNALQVATMHIPIVVSTKSVASSTKSVASAASKMNTSIQIGTKMSPVPVADK